MVSSNSLYWIDLFDQLKIKKSLPENVDLPKEDPMEFICSCGLSENKGAIYFNRATNEYIARGKCNLNKPCCAIAVDKHRLQMKGLALGRSDRFHLAHQSSESPSANISPAEDQQKKDGTSSGISQLEKFLMQYTP